MKYILLFILLASITLSGCEKEQNRKLLGAYFKFTVDGVPVVINDETGLSDNTFDCIIKGDSALYINVAKLYQGAGFYIKSDTIKSGTYTLDSLRKGYYQNPKDYKRYTTNNSYKGYLTIKKNVFQAKSMLNTLEGTFAYQTEDTLTHKVISITDGSFLMERVED